MADRGLDGLAVFARAGGFLFALDAAAVERIVLPDQIDAEVRRPTGTASRVQVGGQWYPVQSLAALFGVSERGHALVLVRLDGEIALAIEVGACLKVAALPALTPIPAAAVRGRGAAVRGAFATAGVLATEPAPYGLALDLARLLAPDELSAARAELREAMLEDWGPV